MYLDHGSCVRLLLRGNPPTPTEELESSDAMFVGKAVENGLEDPNPRDHAKFGGIRFDVRESWKGIPGDSVVLYG